MTFFVFTCVCLAGRKQNVFLHRIGTYSLGVKNVFSSHDTSGLQHTIGIINQETIKDKDTTNCVSVTLYTLSSSENINLTHTTISASPVFQYVVASPHPLSPWPSPCWSGAGAQRKGVSGWAWEACVQRG